jgi:DNA-binding PadR family transcriptional regulator
MAPDLNPLLPLSPAILHILLALSAGERHGYGIMREVARQSDGRYKLGPGTLYDNLQKLEEQGVVEEVHLKSSVEESRRRYYKLTESGRQLLLTEINRLEGVIREAKLNLMPRTERAR